jgi:hypothetical protein
MKERKNEDGMLEVFTEGQEVVGDQVVVLGMRNQFEARAQYRYELALKEGKSTGSELFNFLNSAIDEVATSGSFEIDRPAFHKTFDSGNLENIRVIPSEIS